MKTIASLFVHKQAIIFCKIVIINNYSLLLIY